MAGSFTSSARQALARIVWRLEPPWAPRRGRTTVGHASDAELRVVMVCLGNYCRSPVAEEVLRSQLAAAGLGSRVTVASAGTSRYYAGRHPHALARSEARRHGLDIRHHRSRVLDPAKVEPADLVVAVDRRTREELTSGAFGLAPETVVLLGEFGRGGDIVDPNGRDAETFADVHEAIDEACKGLVAEITRRLERGRDVES